MNRDYSLLFKKMKDGASVLDLYDDFGIVCTDIPFVEFGATKSMSVRTWPDEDGEDAYFPDAMTADAYDWKIKMACAGTKTYERASDFVKWVCGRSDNGTQLMMYSKRIGTGRKNCYFKSIGDFSFHKENSGNEVLEFTTTFRVCDPRTDISPVFGKTYDTITNLTEA